MTDNCHDTLVKLRVMNCRRSYTKLHSCMSFCIKNPRISVPKSAETAANRWSEPIRPIYGWTEHDLNLKSRPLPCGIGVVAGSCRGSKLGIKNQFEFKYCVLCWSWRHLSSSRASSTVHLLYPVGCIVCVQDQHEYRARNRPQGPVLENSNSNVLEIPHISFQI